MKPEPWHTQMRREAQFGEAAARLRLYREKEAERAILILTDLIDRLREDLAASPATKKKDEAHARAEAARTDAENTHRIAQKSINELKEVRRAKGSAISQWDIDGALSAERRARSTLEEAMKTSHEADASYQMENSYRLKLLAVSHAQLAYTHATIFAFMSEGKAPPGDHGDRMAENLKLAQEKFSEVGEVGVGWVSEREKQDAQFRIDNTRGYGIYRRAYFGASSNDIQYRKLCDEAIVELEKANACRPNHYEMLQNLAMIYADSRYDADGNSWPDAQRLFERTKKFVPEDYYQYEQLAWIHWKRAEIYHTAATAKPELDQGVQEANLALTKRPGTAGALHVLALLAKKSWELSDPADDALGTAALKAFRDACRVRYSNEEFRSAYIAFLEAFATTRDNSASGLNDIVEAEIELAENLEPNQRSSELASSARKHVNRSLELTTAAGTSSDLRPVHERAVKLAEEVKQIFDAAKP